MLIQKTNEFYFICDLCGTESIHYPSYEALLVGTHFGNSLYDEPPGWVSGLSQLQVTGDDSIAESNEYQWQRGILNLTTHVGPECRGLVNLY